MTPLAYGSLCTGYDGIGQALSLTDLSVSARFHAETEPSVSHVLKLMHPDVRNVGDIKTVPWHMAPHTDILSSGDPCQSISIAGRKAGRDDPRFLWPWVRKAYRAVQPGAIFFENVANIVSHDRGRTMAERFAHLQEDGYAVRWTVLGACAVGAPHHRHRWYAVAGYVGTGAPEAVRVGGDKAICGAPRSGGRWLLPTPRGDAWGAETNRAERTGTGGTLSDAVALLPTPRATDGPNGGPNQRNGRGEYDALPGLVANLLPTPTVTNQYGNGNNNRGELLLPGIAVRPEVWGKYAEAVALWERLTGVPAPEPSEAAPKGGGRLSPQLPEWMMGLAPGMLTAHMNRTDALKAAGNGVVPQAAAAAWRLLTERRD
jgi:DNA (cytosine-5)-methyltransferase 1